MNIIQLTPGAAGMYCGGCMRDNAVVSALRKLGHDAIMVPLYTPLTTDEPDNSTKRVFFGGVNVWLQQNTRIFRKTPGWLDNIFDSNALLNYVSRFAVKTKPEDLGGMTVSMLQGEDGLQAKEIDKLVAFLKTQPRTDVICLSNALLIGMARRLRSELNVPVVCTLQGEDSFLDGLPDPHRAKAWQTLRERAADVDMFIAVSKYFGTVMSERLAIPAERMTAVLNGIDLKGYAPAAQPPAVPTVGFLSHMTPPKGLSILVDAFKRLHAKMPSARLRIAGSVPGSSQAYVDGLKKEVERDGLSGAIDFLPNISRDEKIRFLQSLSVLSVPATYGEAFGLYILEANACGVPVVQPDHAAFPEILAATGGGVLCARKNPQDLADKLYELLNDPARRSAMGTGARERVLAHFSVERVAREVAVVFEKAAGAFQKAQRV